MAKISDVEVTLEKVMEDYPILCSKLEESRLSAELSGEQVKMLQRSLTDEDSELGTALRQIFHVVDHDMRDIRNILHVESEELDALKGEFVEANGRIEGLKTAIRQYSSGEKISVPFFDGEDFSKSKRRAHFRYFDAQMRIKLLMDKQFYKTPLEQVLLVFSKLKGETRGHVEPYLDAYLQNPKGLDKGADGELLPKWRWKDAPDLLAGLRHIYDYVS